MILVILSFHLRDLYISKFPWQTSCACISLNGSEKTKAHIPKAKVRERDDGQQDSTMPRPLVAVRDFLLQCSSIDDARKLLLEREARVAQ
jgi:hypothetical protein